MPSSSSVAGIGDPEAWNELVERFSRYVYAIAAQGFRLSPADAEDVFQEVFTRVYTRLDTLRDEAALRPWIAQLTRRVCLDLLAASGRVQPVEEVMAGDEARWRSSSTLIDEAFTVREALAELSELLPGDARPLLRARRELQDDLQRARSSRRDDREPHLPLSATSARRARREEMRRRTV